MYEGLTPHDDFADDSEFDRVEERVVPMQQFAVSHGDVDFLLTPANSTVRMFFDENNMKYNRVMVYLDDGTVGSVKLEEECMQGMVRGGFPVELPERPDETDEEFMDGYVQSGIDETLSKTTLDD